MASKRLEMIAQKVSILKKQSLDTARTRDVAGVNGDGNGEL